MKIGVMVGVLVSRLEKIADGVASSSFGGAVAFAVFHLPLAGEVLPALVAGAAIIACLASWRLLRLVRRATPGRARRVREANVDTAAADPVVVPLFGSAAAVAHGQSTNWIGRLPPDLSPAVDSDASVALHQALDQLRRSLR